MKTPLRETWDLESIFPGGSKSPQLEAFLQEAERDLASFEQAVASLEGVKGVDDWLQLFETLQDLAARLRSVTAFSSCLLAQDVKDAQAKILLGKTQALSAQFTAQLTLVDKHLMNIDEHSFGELIGDERIRPIAFNIDERRRRAAEKLSPELEVLINDLSVDGYSAWGNLYNTLIGRITIPFELDGEEKQLSVGQAQNLYNSHPDRAVRAALFAKWEETFAQEAEPIAAALNSIAGFRLQVFKHRGWDSVLREPLEVGRMSEATLHAMWETIDRNKDIFVDYLNRKAELLGVEKLAWYDLDASLGSADSRMSFEEGAAFIIEQFRKFSEPMANFAVRAFEGGWIEAEDRPGKRPGGFCTSVAIRKESRIFMTYDGSMGGVATLAHELGHAYHQQVVFELPQLAQSYAMNVAETASTFAEMIVADAALRKAESREERLALLDNKIQSAVAFFMDIHSRFLFETKFYDERRKGLVSVARLNELMVDAQKQGFRDGLSVYHPHFWASKLHFYSTGVQFYNWPYTFGYLFSAGIYARAMQEGPSFADKYVDLLRDTARMRVEDLAMTHLGVDLRQPQFWQSAIDLAVADVKEFLRLTDAN